MQLAPWLAELSARECARALPLQIQCLRFGQIVNTAEAAAQPYDPRWLHIEDAVAAIQCALRREPRPDRERDWQIFHIAAAGDRAKVRLVGARRETFGYQPQHDFRDRWPAAPEETAGDARPWQEILAPPQPIPSRPIQKVVIFGAGGPLGAALTQELKNDYILRLTDLRPLAEIAAEGKPQSEGAPLPVPLEPPHENRVVDVRDAAQVLAACEGMDAIINCSVLRHDPTDAFLVNMLGAYHMALGAAQHRIRRLVQTGPQLVTLHDENDYSWDYDVPGDPPERPGRHLYGHSKYLGQEILRVFADHYGLEVPVLLFTAFINPKFAHWFHPMIVTWEDSARALRGALETTALPSPYEVMHITTDLPHGRYSNRKAKTLLGWQPQDLLESLWK
jgi:nucleoside-diphosphate-sugar epimerase